MSIKRYFQKLVQWHTDKLLLHRSMKQFTNFIDSDVSVSPRSESPIIVIGMHRSGTSLVTRLLEDLNVTMGVRQGKKTSEDLFFRRQNQLLFKMAHATWDNPSALSQALEDSRWKRTFSHVISHELESYKRLHKGSLYFKKNQHWGFKDPRSSITLPVWIDIFPNAKVIHVVRNGHAASSSLFERGKRSLKKNKIPSLVSLTPSLSLDLWAEYVMTARKHCESLPFNQSIEIKYENILDSPTQTLHEISHFLDLHIDESLFKKAASRVTHPQNPITDTDPISDKAKKVLELYNY